MTTTAGMAVRIGYYSIFGKNCTAGPIPDLVVSGPLKGGLVIIQDATLETKKLANCPTMKGPARVVFYKPQQTFSGDENVTIKVVNPVTGESRNHAFKITVKAP